MTWLFGFVCGLMAGVAGGALLARWVLRRHRRLGDRLVTVWPGQVFVWPGFEFEVPRPMNMTVAQVEALGLGHACVHREWGRRHWWTRVGGRRQAT